MGSGFGVGSGSLIAGTDGSFVGLSVFSGFSGSTGACSFSSGVSAFDSVGALTGSEEIAGSLSCLSSFGMQAVGSAASVGALVGALESVDTGSKDETREIARRYTPHVYDFSWKDDFSAARNESFAHATRDFLM